MTKSFEDKIMDVEINGKVERINQIEGIVSHVLYGNEHVETDSSEGERIFSITLRPLRSLAWQNPVEKRTFRFKGKPNIKRGNYVTTGIRLTEDGKAEAVYLAKWEPFGANSHIPYTRIYFIHGYVHSEEILERITHW